MTRPLLSGGRRRRLPPEDDAGATLLEMVLVLAVIVLVTCLASPVTASFLDAEKARQAAGFVATRFRHARQHAVAGAASVGIVFDTAGGRTTFRMCVDGNGNGIRRAEIETGQDDCRDGPHDIAVMFQGVRIAVDPSLRDPDGETGSADAVRFGRSEIASFSSAGTCTAGSLFLRTAGGIQFVVRVAGVTGRTRILRYEPATRTWSEL